MVTDYHIDVDGIFIGERLPDSPRKHIVIASPGIKNRLPALQIRAHPQISEMLQQPPELGHGQTPMPRDVDAP